MTITIHCESKATHQLLQQLVTLGHFSVSRQEDASIVIVYGVPPPPDTPSIVIPSPTPSFRSWLRNHGITYTAHPAAVITISATPRTALTIHVKSYYQYSGLHLDASPPSTFPSMVRYHDTVLLTVDIVEEYRTLLEQVLHPPISLWYSTLTRLPIHYTHVPPKIRSFFLKNRSKSVASLALTDKLPLDTLRYILFHAITEITSMPVRQPRWHGKRFIGLITHDIESADGLKKATRLQALELRYDLPATWFLPTHHYALTPHARAIQRFAAHGEIGAHGTHHDGKLTFLSPRRITHRVSDAKSTLEQFDGPVHGIRTPLLQCNTHYLSAIREAGYTYDASLPTWEPKNPCTLQPHGIGTVNCLTLNGVTEIPVTVPQDHQMLYILGLTPQETVETWTQHMQVIKDLGGLFTILVHPGYRLANEGLAYYEELLNALTNESDVYLTTLSNIASPPSSCDSRSGAH